MASIFIGTDTDGKRQSVWETGAKQVARTVGSQVGRQIVRGILGGLKRW